MAAQATERYIGLFARRGSKQFHGEASTVGASGFDSVKKNRGIAASEGCRKQARRRRKRKNWATKRRPAGVLYQPAGPRFHRLVLLFLIVDLMMKGLHGRSTLSRWRFLLWWLSNNRIRFLLGLCLLFGLFVLAGRVSSIMGWRHHPLLSHLPPSRQAFTILINTWRRPDLLKKSVHHYSSCSNVDAIRVVWSETDLPSESLLSDLHQYAKFHKVKLKVDLHDEDNLNTRFKPLEGLNTDGIFSVDDDVVVSCETLKFAFSVWASAPDSMVGFVPRMHWLDSKKYDTQHSHYTYGGWWSVWWTGTYSMVLSKCALLHHKYLEFYTYHMPAEFRNYVTSERNCEDIAMSFLVANSTGAPPIWVKGKLFEIGSTGISSLTGHSKQRTACLNKFMDMYGHNPLVASNVKAVDARSTWFW